MLSQSAKASKVLLGHGFDSRPLMAMPLVTRYADPNGMFDQLMRAAAPTPDAWNPEAILPDFTRAQSLSREDRLALMARPDTPDGVVIDIIKTPIFLHHLAWLAMRAGPDKRKDALDDLAQYSQIYGGEYITYNETGADRLSAVLDPATGKVAGLHVDNRGRLPLEWRHLSRRRMGCNTGPSNRMLVACFPDVLTMAIELGKTPSLKPTNATFNYILHEYVHVYPGRAACVAFTAKPLEAWLFPTDCMAHDGSTLGYENSDITLLLGHWKRMDTTMPTMPLVYS